MCPAAQSAAVCMEFRATRGRGGGWKRGGRGVTDGDGEHRDRGGRGCYHRGRGKRPQHQGRGRGKRPQHQGRGRGGGPHVADLSHQDQDEEDSFEPEDEGMETFSRRKLESNWGRYVESEKAESADMPTQRGTDFHVLLETAGDSFTQFRLSDEKDWDTDSFEASQMSAVFLDLVELTKCLRHLPLHQRLDLEPELVQVSTPIDLPAMNVAPKQDTHKLAVHAPPTATLKELDARRVAVATNPAPGLDVGLQDVDEELDQLLSLQKPVSENQFVQTEDENLLPVKLESEDVTTEDKTEEVVETVAPPLVRQQVTEEDLEDWLDSMIS
ncbi:cell death regulator Aven [Thalassophryne amazonica]|uniref:cell death regulator Aven n=1 Tax=Thalassophryne amazonica TaxID=390379 RepID=UPI001471CB39|nr:cell death regulator Aven [Thalassophryne amazonica]XP_034017840.1 cell death regulator Aven [Thalassophryne amazonica]